MVHETPKNKHKPKLFSGASKLLKAFSRQEGRGDSVTPNLDISAVRYVEVSCSKVPRPIITIITSYVC